MIREPIAFVRDEGLSGVGGDNKVGNIGTFILIVIVVIIAMLVFF